MKSSLLPLLRTFQIICASTLLISIILLVFSIPARFTQLNKTTPELNIFSGALSPVEIHALSQAGISLPAYATYVTILEFITSFSGILVGAIIFWRKRDDMIALAVSLALITIGTFPTPLMTSVIGNVPALSPVVTLLQFIGIGPSFLVFYLFPDGRFVPSWSRWFAYLWLAYSIAWLVYPPLKPPLSIFAIQASPPLLSLFTMTALGVGIYSQIHRYLHHATPVQRQQSKWIIFGFCITLSIMLVFGILASFFEFDSSTRETMLFLLVFIGVILLGLSITPFTVMLSILQYRLWDIDILIRRTIQYSILTGLLALIYLSSVIFFQGVFSGLTGNRDSPLITVITTLGVAALFNPLRLRTQDFIDRRFYRTKYNAEQALAKFAATARDEVDMDKLAGALLAVVEETMQPESLSFWLKKEAK